MTTAEEINARIVVLPHTTMSPLRWSRYNGMCTEYTYDCACGWQIVVFAWKASKTLTCWEWIHPWIGGMDVDAEKVKVLAQRLINGHNKKRLTSKCGLRQEDLEATAYHIPNN